MSNTIAESAETAESTGGANSVGLANVARLFCPACGVWIPHVYVTREGLNAFLCLLCQTVEVWRLGEDGQWVITKRKAKETGRFVESKEASIERG